MNYLDGMNRCYKRDLKVAQKEIARLKRLVSGDSSQAEIARLTQIAAEEAAKAQESAAKLTTMEETLNSVRKTFEDTCMEAAQKESHLEKELNDLKEQMRIDKSFVANITRKLFGNHL